MGKNRGPSLQFFLDTLSDVLSSGLTWGLILYGEEEEGIMEASKDEVIQKIWQVKLNLMMMTTGTQTLC